MLVARQALSDVRSTLSGHPEAKGVPSQIPSNFMSLHFQKYLFISKPLAVFHATHPNRI
jgi:hypothetical protein